MDPIEIFPSEVIELIFEHLTSNDILTATKVSSHWNDFIGASKLMTKIKVNISWNQKLSSCSFREVMMDTARNYENLSFQYLSCMVKDVCDFLIIPGRKWKVLNLKRINFACTLDAIKFFKAVESTVEELRLEEVYINSTYLDALNTMPFRKLKILKGKYVQTLLYYQAFASCTNLKELFIKSGDQSYGSMKAFKTMLMLNKDLKKLEISSNLLSQIFNEDVSMDIVFKLEHFALKNSFCAVSHHVAVKDNFRRFLSNQMFTLKVVSLDKWMGIDTLKLLLNMPNLKELTIKEFDFTETIDWENVSLQTNKSVEKMHYHDIENNIDIFKALVNALPNLKELKLFSLYQKLFEHLADSLKQLEVLKLRTIEVTDLGSKDLFPKLISVDVEVIQQGMEETLQKIPDGQRNRLVELLLESNYTILH